MSRNDEILSDKRRKFRDLEAPYLRAQEYLKSEQFTKDKLKALDKIDSIMKTVYVQEIEALFIMGRVAQVLTDLKEQESIIATFESEKRSIEDFMGQLERMK